MCEISWWFRPRLPWEYYSTGKTCFHKKGDLAADRRWLEMPVSSYNAAFVTNNGGTAATAFAVLLAGLNAGDAYLNIHSMLFPGGEIRGFLAATPVPAALPLFAGGLGLRGFLPRRRKRKSARSVSQPLGPASDPPGYGPPPAS